MCACVGGVARTACPFHVRVCWGSAKHVAAAALAAAGRGRPPAMGRGARDRAAERAAGAPLRRETPRVPKAFRRFFIHPRVRAWVSPPPPRSFDPRGWAAVLDYIEIWVRVLPVRSLPAARTGEITDTTPWRLHPGKPGWPPLSRSIKSVVRALHHLHKGCVGYLQKDGHEFAALQHPPNKFVFW